MVFKIIVETFSCCQPSWKCWRSSYPEQHWRWCCFYDAQETQNTLIDEGFNQLLPLSIFWCLRSWWESGRGICTSNAKVIPGSELGVVGVVGGWCGVHKENQNNPLGWRSVHDVLSTCKLKLGWRLLITSYSINKHSTHVVCLWYIILRYSVGK